MKRKHNLIVWAMCIVLLFGTLTLGAQGSKESATPASQVKKAQTFAGGWPYPTPPTGHFNMFVAISWLFFAISIKSFESPPCFVPAPVTPCCAAHSSFRLS